MNQIEISIISLIVMFIATIVVFIIVILCTLIYHILHRRQEEAQASTPTQSNGSVESQPEVNDERGDTEDRELTHLPPPTYQNACQYQNVSLEQIEAVQMTSTYRSSIQSDVTKNQQTNYNHSSRSQNNVFTILCDTPSELQLPEDDSALPPPYNTAVQQRL